jgi:hypothetical protein
MYSEFGDWGIAGKDIAKNAPWNPGMFSPWQRLDRSILL